MIIGDKIIEGAIIDTNCSLFFNNPKMIKYCYLN